MKRDLKDAIGGMMILVPLVIIVLWTAVAGLGWALGLLAFLLICVMAAGFIVMTS